MSMVSKMPVMMSDGGGGKPINKPDGDSPYGTYQGNPYGQSEEQDRASHLKALARKVEAESGLQHSVVQSNYGDYSYNRETPKEVKESFGKFMDNFSYESVVDKMNEKEKEIKISREDTNVVGNIVTTTEESNAEKYKDFQFIDGDGNAVDDYELAKVDQLKTVGEELIPEAGEEVETVETTIVDDTNTFTTETEFTHEYKALPEADLDMFLDDAQSITDPMIKLMEENAELQKQGIDNIKAQRQLEFDFLATKQQYSLAQMQSKANIPEAMRGQQFNQLMLNQFVEMSDAYTQLDLQKLDVDNELIDYKVAMQEKNYEIANQKYGEALQRAMIGYDITGEYIPPELDYMYSQLDIAEKTMSNASEDTPEYAKAQKLYDEVSGKVKDLGFTPGEHRGYKARKDAYAEYMNEFDKFMRLFPIEQEQYRIASQKDTYSALIEFKELGVWNLEDGDSVIDISKIYEIFERYPNVDVEALLGPIAWSDYGQESPTGEDITLGLRDKLRGK